MPSAAPNTSGRLRLNANRLRAVDPRRRNQMPDDDESHAEETDNSGDSSEETSDTFELEDEYSKKSLNDFERK